MTLAEVFSSSNVMINKSLPLFLCIFTPSIFFRIAPILALVFQEEQLGTVNCTILSLAGTTPAKNAVNSRHINMLTIFFILYLFFLRAA
jgi:hypothetical protein